MSIKHPDPGKNASGVVAILVTRLLDFGFTECFLSRARRRGGHRFVVIVSWERKRNTKAWRHLLEMSRLESVRPFVWVLVASSGPETPGCLLQVDIWMSPPPPLATSPHPVLSRLGQPVPLEVFSGLVSSPPGLDRAALSSYDRRLQSKMERFSWQLQIFNHESNLI